MLSLWSNEVVVTVLNLRQQHKVGSVSTLVTDCPKPKRKPTTLDWAHVHHAPTWTWMLRQFSSAMKWRATKRSELNLQSQIHIEWQNEHLKRPKRANCCRSLGGTKTEAENDIWTMDTAPLLQEAARSAGLYSATRHCCSLSTSQTCKGPYNSLAHARNSDEHTPTTICLIACWIYFSTCEASIWSRQIIGFWLQLMCRSLEPILSKSPKWSNRTKATPTSCKIQIAFSQNGIRTTLFTWNLTMPNIFSVQKNLPRLGSGSKKIHMRTKLSPTAQNQEAGGIFFNLKWRCTHSPTLWVAFSVGFWLLQMGSEAWRHRYIWSFQVLTCSVQVLIRAPTRKAHTRFSSFHSAGWPLWIGPCKLLSLWLLLSQKKVFLLLLMLNISRCHLNKMCKKNILSANRSRWQLNARKHTREVHDLTVSVQYFAILSRHFFLLRKACSSLNYQWI